MLDIHISPFHQHSRTIYWTEAYEDTGAILTSDVDGQMIDTLASNDVHYPQHLHIDYDLGRYS